MEPEFHKQMSFTRTILGDIHPGQMGVTYSHEHIVIDESYVTMEYPSFILNDQKKIAGELIEINQLGCSTMVDTMPANAGRNVLMLAEISLATGINILACTGMHLEMYYPQSHWRYTYNEDQLTRLFVEDITVGIDKFDYNGPLVERTTHKAGLIKLATAEEPITIHQEKIFRAVVNAHMITGTPILTHTNNGGLAIAQAEMFQRLGADLSHVVISHVDKNKDLGYHHALMQTGVNVEYDSAFRWNNEDENWTYTLLEKLLPLYPNQFTVGMDAARNAYWKSYGGAPGLSYLLTTFKRQMHRRTLDAFLDNLFVVNPGRIFSNNLKTY